VCVLGDMLDELTAIVDGYNSYFSFSKLKSGYSGQKFLAAVLLLPWQFTCSSRSSFLAGHSIVLLEVL